MPPTHEQFAELLKNQQRMMQELTETSTVVRRHVVEQETINQRTERILVDLDARVRQTETQVARIDEKLVDDPVEHQDFQRLEEKVDGLGMKIASWSGGIAAIVCIGGFIIKGLFS